MDADPTATAATDALGTSVREQWGVQYDDGEIDAMWSRTGCIEALAAIQTGIDRGEYDEADYAGRRMVKRTITTTVGPWESA